MDAELKQKWIAALRSGDYAQGTHALRTPSGRMCCLGVLCVVAQIDLDDVEKKFGTLSLTYPPSDAGLIDPDEATKLSRMNDDRGASFPEIADYIEKNL